MNYCCSKDCVVPGPFLFYYKLDESIISDTEYDRICMELRELLKKHPEADLPFRKIAEKALGDEASGYSIRQYPPSIISVIDAFALSK